MFQSARTFGRSYEDYDLAKLYNERRPAYSSEIPKIVISYMEKQMHDQKNTGKFSRMIDVGCGGGQATSMFSPFFESILGIDISAAQISVAKGLYPDSNMKFQTVNDDRIPAESNSVDLVICATAAHFLDMEIFKKECERVLKPGGCVAVFAYIITNIQQINSTSSTEHSSQDLYIQIHNEFLRRSKASPKNDYIDSRYKNIFDRINVENKSYISTLVETRLSTLAEYKSCMATIGEYHTMSKNIDFTIDPLDWYECQIRKLVSAPEDVSNDELKLALTYEFPLILFHKYSKL
ncbi:putative methyltransferase DDB_G0268948 [Styela clava]